MNTTLSQSADAGFPDRGQTGMSITLAPGNEGAYLSYELEQASPVVHTRFAMSLATASGGVFRLAGGHDAVGEALWWIDCDSDDRSLCIRFAEGAEMTVGLNSLPWHVVELRVDTAADEAALWINGVAGASVTGDIGASTTRRLWLGSLFKDTALAGEVHLDEWVIASEFIGPVTVPPTRPYGDDPTRWLVIYNRAVPESATWAGAYRQARGVPLANLLGLDLPVAETIDASQYAELTAAVNDYLDRTGLGGQVMGVLTGYRVPGYVDFDNDGRLDAVPALLHRGVTHEGLVVNANSAETLSARPRWDDLGEDRLTARIDGPDLDAALALIDRATVLREAGLGDGSQAKLWFDPFAGDGEAIHGYTLDMIEWARGLDCQRLRLPMVFSAELDADDEPASFEAVHDDGFVWIWDIAVPPLPPTGFFAEPSGRRVACLHLHIIEPVATTVRSVWATNWIETALACGYAAAVASPRGYTASAVPRVQPFFEALRRGWTLAEAWYMALPLLREGLYLVGDPLLGTEFPRRGWDVFGPMEGLEELKPDAPSQMLRNECATLALADAQPEPLVPAEGSRAFYVVRHVDEKGRSEASVTSVRLLRKGGGAVREAMVPVWPNHWHWRVQVEAGQIVMRLLWERSLAEARVARVELRGEVDGEPERTLTEPALDGRRVGVCVALAMPATQGRYRWRVFSVDDVVFETPWSRWMYPRVAAGEPLRLLEVRS